MKVPQPSGEDRPAPARDGGHTKGWRAWFQAALLDWYGLRARPLRIRSSTDPWALLVAEVMAQQTQIARVDEVWVTFMGRYPTPGVLAVASTADVLRAWSGLGYNRRAVNLQRTARCIMAEHGGRVPREIGVLESLPGIGPYTARAVAATAFGQPVAAVDTNVRRVVSRVLREPLSPRQLQSAADALVDRADPATWTHASMDLGATICRSRRPRCEDCPVSSWCKSAGRVVEVSTSRSPKVPFEHTSRWLRGHIVERLRALDHGAWTRLRAPIGTHDESAVALAISTLQQDGLLEQRPDGSVRLPSSDT